MDGRRNAIWREATNVPGARDFYGRLFGWTPSETSFEPFASYVFFKSGDVHETGILPIEPNWGIKPRWNSIFAVDDCNASIKQAHALGGCEVFTHNVPKAGRIGLLNDPGGALFLIRGPVPTTER